MWYKLNPKVQGQIVYEIDWVKEITDYSMRVYEMLRGGLNSCNFHWRTLIVDLRLQH